MPWPATARHRNGYDASRDGWSTMTDEVAEPRVTSVVDGAVIVTDDPDHLIGALLTALLAEPDDTRLHVLVRGTHDVLELPGLRIRRFRSAIDPAPTGAPTWSVTRHGEHGATTTVRGELIERLFDQAYEHRRAAQMAVFPVGARLGGGRYTITETLRGTPDRGMFRARAPGAAASYLVTLSPPQDRTPAELGAVLALEVPGIAPLALIGPLEPPSEAAHDGMVEVEPPGVPASDLALPLAPPVAAALALEVARIAAAAHAVGFAIGGLRPELVYVQSAAAPVITSVAPRAERFWLTGKPRCYGVAPCFDQFFHAPELLARPHDPPAASGDVFAIAAMLACWLAGEHPFDGEGPSQAIAIATGRRRPWRGPAELEAILDRALALEPAVRTSLDVLIAQLEGGMRGSR
jgi:hypothetical protein